MCELVAGLVDTEFYIVKHRAVNLRNGRTLPSQKARIWTVECGGVAATGSAAPFVEVAFRRNSGWKLPQEFEGLADQVERTGDDYGWVVGQG